MCVSQASMADFVQCEWFERCISSPNSNSVLVCGMSVVVCVYVLEGWGGGGWGRAGVACRPTQARPRE